MKPAVLSCILIDDDLVSLTILENYCRKSGMIEVLARFSEPAEGLAFLKNTVVDLVFLDVEMPEITGFQLIDQLTYTPQIVLTTSKTDYAFTAFQYEVAGYLKKPVTYDRFLRTVGKIAEQNRPATPPPVTEATPVPEPAPPVQAPPVQAAPIQATSGSSDSDIFIRSDGKLVRIGMDEILYVECIGDYVRYVTTDQKIVSHATMKNVQEKLSNNSFLKVHRSFIVNTRKIKDIQDNNLVINGSIIPISRAHKAEVMQRLTIL